MNGPGAVYSSNEITDYYSKSYLIRGSHYICWVPTYGRVHAVWDGITFIDNTAMRHHHIDDGIRNGRAYPLYAATLEA